MNKNTKRILLSCYAAVLLVCGALSAKASIEIFREARQRQTESADEAVHTVDTSDEVVHTVAVAEEPEAPFQPCLSEHDPAGGPVSEESTDKSKEPIEKSTEKSDELSLTDEEIEWLAITIYKEAGGDAVCDECRYRVADVILNRVADERFPDTMYGVLMQKGQYNTYYWDGGIYWPDRAFTEPEVLARERALFVAADVAAGNHSDLYGRGYIGQAEMIQGYEGFWHCGIYFAKW